MIKSCYLLLSFLSLYSCLTVAQTGLQKGPVKPQEPHYNADFKGIGPRVYELPAPRSYDEVLRDKYQAKQGFSLEIAQALTFHKIIENLEINLRNTYNPALQEVLQLLKKKDIRPALQALKDCQQAAKQQNLPQQELIISQLQGDLLYCISAYSEAELANKQFLDLALKLKHKIAQADAYVQLALIQAHQRQGRQAQQLIIRKAIPLYNKEKAYAKKIWAWEQLAEVYRVDKQYTEAQWFLLQARELAINKKLTQELAEIEYHLALSKHQDKSFKVARVEFLSAKKLAEAENNPLLLLAIYDKLGEVQLQLKEYPEAEKTYTQYSSLKEQLRQLFL